MNYRTNGSAYRRYIGQNTAPAGCYPISSSASANIVLQATLICLYSIRARAMQRHSRGGLGRILLGTQRLCKRCGESTITDRVRGDANC